MHVSFNVSSSHYQPLSQPNITLHPIVEKAVRVGLGVIFGGVATLKFAVFCVTKDISMLFGAGAAALASYAAFKAPINSLSFCINLYRKPFTPIYYQPYHPSPITYAPSAPPLYDNNSYYSPVQSIHIPSTQYGAQSQLTDDRVPIGRRTQGYPSITYETATSQENLRYPVGQRV